MLHRSSTTQPFTFDPDALTSAVDRLLGMFGNRELKRNIQTLPVTVTESAGLRPGHQEDELDSDDLDDEEGEEDEEEEVEPSGPAGMNGTETLDGLRTYMDQMDKELMGTNIGQSFNVSVTRSYTSACLPTRS